MLSEPTILTTDYREWLRAEARAGRLYTDTGADPILQAELERLAAG